MAARAPLFRMPDPLVDHALPAPPARGERVALVVAGLAVARPLCRTLAAEGVRLAVAGSSVREVTALCAAPGRYGEVTTLPSLAAPGGPDGTRRLVAAVVADHQRLDALVLDPAVAPPAAALVTEAARAMADGGRPGRIVLTGAVPALAEVRHWARAWSGRGVTVNLLWPGPGARAEDLAAAAVLLLSPLARGITGQAIEVSAAPRA